MSKGCFELQVLVRKIIQFKEKHKLTYQQMANGLGVDKSYVHKVVNMKTFPSFPVLCKLSRFMEMPLCFLFLPAEEEVREEMAKLINQRLEEIEMSFDDLQAKTEIPHLRLMDILQGNTSLSKEEEEAISKVLKLTELYNYRKVKMRMLKQFLGDMDLVENQVDNVIQYIQGHM